LAAFTVTPIFFASMVHDLWSAVYLLGLATAGHQAWSSNLYPLVSDLFPRRMVGSVSGLGGTAGYGGASLFAVLTGYILLWTNENYAIVFAIVSTAYLVAVTAVHLLTPAYRPAVVNPDTMCVKCGYDLRGTLAVPGAT